jgi:uncharacterized protein YndB with AHSA1/START domain
MTAEQEVPRVVQASREIGAAPERIFELIADPAQQPRWDGNENLGEAQPGQRVHGVGEVFRTTLTSGAVRENHVVEFEEGRRIAWQPAEVGASRPGHLWRWELEALGENRTLVIHTYDWTLLTEAKRLQRARSTTADGLRASLDRLAALAEARLPTGAGAKRAVGLIQPRARSTARFQLSYSVSRCSSSMLGSHCDARCQLRRRTSRSGQ